MTNHFADKLTAAIKEKNSVVCVGLDPRIDQIPAHIVTKAKENYGMSFESAAEAIIEFNKAIIDAIADLVPVVKPQIAFYELFGEHGMRAFKETCKYAQDKGLLVLADIKRSDIGSTAKAYAQAYLGETEFFGTSESVMNIDAVTLNPFMGYDSVDPFMVECRKHGKGIFVLVKTSNASSGDFQDRKIDESGLSISDLAASFVESWAFDEVGESGYSFVGSVVGATYPRDLGRLRELMPSSYILVPGYGAQGGTAEDVKAAFDENGLGALINSSRGIIFAYETEGDAENYADAARQAVIAMNEDLNGVRQV
jgi:orotidine-5'-phosphate decarboxylase